MTAAEGIDYRRPLRSSAPIEAAYETTRAIVPRLTADRSLSKDIEALASAIRQGTFDRFMDSTELPAAVNLAILNCAELVTLAGPPRPRVRDELKELSIIPNGAMLVRGEKIERIGPRDQIETYTTPEYRVIDAGGRIVLPGFVDAHTHPVFAANRVAEYELRSQGATYEQIAASGGGIRSTVRKTREASEEDLIEAAKRRTQWFLRNGTTTIEAKSGYGLSLESELKILRVIRRLNQESCLRLVPTFLGAHEIPDEFQGKVQEYVELLIHKMLPEVAEAGLAEYCDVFCEPAIFNVEAGRRIFGKPREI